MKTRKLPVLATVAVLMVAPGVLHAQTPVGTEFTYQGQLRQAGDPVDGQADMVFRLYDAAAGGNQVGSTVGPAFVDVADGLFTVQLDFGAAAFNGDARWLEVEVEFPSGEGNWTTLSPRQPMTPAPYALYALSGPGGGGHWAANGDDIYNTNAGDVGIGITTPSSPLHVVGSGSRTARVRNTSATGGTALLAEATGGSGYSCALNAYVCTPTGDAVYAFNEADSGNAHAFSGETSSPDGVAIYGLAGDGSEYSTGIGVYGKSNGDYNAAGVYGEAATTAGTGYGVRGVASSGTGVRGDHQGTGNYGKLGTSTAGVYGRTGQDYTYAVRGYAGSANAYAGYFTGGRNYFEGDVGIGTTAPGARLHVAQATVSGNTIIGQGTVDGASPNILLEEDCGENANIRLNEANDAALEFQTGGATRLAIRQDGLVGIGTPQPTEALDVVGTVKADGFHLTASPGDGLVLTSDAVGVGTWQPAGGTLWSVNGDDIYNDNSGNVGIGTSTPGSRLDIDRRVFVERIESGSGWIRTAGDSPDAVNVQITNLVDHPGNGYVAVYDSANNIDAGLYVDANSNGVIFADIKNARMPNPNQEGTEIWYACPEGPEAAAYVRGTAMLANGRAEVRLPEHFIAVAGPEGITVQVTPLSAESKGLAVVEKHADRFVVRELFNGSGAYGFDYTVMAVRKGYEDYRVIRPASEALAAEPIDVDQGSE